MHQYTMCNEVKELANQVDLENDLRWISVTEGIDSLPVMLDLTHGSWVVLVKARAGCQMPMHYHTKPLFVFTVSGHWYYPEHDWKAKEGHFLFEVPGELHTPIFLEDTLLYSVVQGPIIYPGLANDGSDIVTDVYTHLKTLRQHYQQVGLSEDDLQKIIR